MNQILYNTSRRRNTWLVILLIALIFTIVFLSTIFAFMNKNNDKILKNVFVSGVDVSEVTEDEAKVLVENKVKEYNRKEVTLILNKQEYRVSAEELGFEAENLMLLLDEAYLYGRGDSFLKNNFTIMLSNFQNKNFELVYSLNDELYEIYISKIVAVNDSLVMDDSYVVSGDKLIITKGQDGLKIDTETLEEYIVTAITNDISQVDIPIIESESKKIDLAKIYGDVVVEPKNAEIISGDKFDVVTEVAGLGFDIEKATAEYNAHKGSGDIVITLEKVEPTITVSDLENQLFVNTISTFTTPYDVKDTNRVKNLTTAAERCNGKIVYPGEEFSFHRTIGTRTVANGYAVANSYAGGKVVTSVGGGICQISSNLYNVVLKANMKIVERKNHGMIVAYAEPGLDATIAEGAIDFRFKNTRKYPIKIVASVANGNATVSIMGIQDKDEPIVELKSVVLETIPYKTIRQNDPTMMQGTTKQVQKPSDGYVAEAYKVLKDANGNVISETLLNKDRYTPIDEVIKVGTKVNTPPPVVVEPDVPVTPVQPEEPEEPDRDLPPGWDSPESPYA